MQTVFSLPEQRTRPIPSQPVSRVTIRMMRLCNVAPSHAGLKPGQLYTRPNVCLGTCAKRSFLSVIISPWRRLSLACLSE